MVDILSEKRKAKRALVYYQKLVLKEGLNLAKSLAEIYNFKLVGKPRLLNEDDIFSNTIAIDVDTKKLSDDMLEYVVGKIDQLGGSSEMDEYTLYLTVK